jgi:DNA-binding NarL/FixJ family response regulator
VNQTGFTVLILANAPTLSSALQALVSSISETQTIAVALELPAGIQLAIELQPDLVILEAGDEMEIAAKQMEALRQVSWSTRFLVLAEDGDAKRAPSLASAEMVVIKGNAYTELVGVIEQLLKQEP